MAYADTPNRFETTGRASPNRSIADILRDLISQVTTLARKESQLARAEVSEKLGQIAGGLAMIVGGAVLLIPALVILLGAAVTALINAGIQPHWAALIVGGGTLLIGALLLLAGLSRLKAEKLVPNRTLDQLQRDADVAKSQIRTAP
ncbi:MAG TPA: phage holin family protein [Ferrovibrio sp.]|jgi:hypothetical protein|uniref:phage holin family protein n=1 Tax=Ferrovibrio sp. TaxID=1917215 RepID=UPI002B4B73EE|nr:phage holin family protein [Ferrovibrio sp.]HLT76803.1 phage holin family protein [Ferrovibrio sp.]